MTDLLTRPEAEQRTQTGSSKADQAHIVIAPPGVDPHALVMAARIEGFAIVALCGYTWVPSKMATGLPICPECESIYNAEDRDDENGSGLPDE